MAIFNVRVDGDIEEGRSGSAHGDADPLDTIRREVRHGSVAGPTATATRDVGRDCARGAGRVEAHRREQGALHGVGVLDAQLLVHDVTGSLSVTPGASPVALVESNVPGCNRAQLWEDCIGYRCRGVRAVEEAAELGRVPMEVQKELDALASAALSDAAQVVLQCVNHWVYDRVRIMPNPVRIHACQSAARVAVHDAVNIDHGHHVEDVSLPQTLRSWGRPQ
mmetsp:Transcript_55758/g.145420  ORF Transcript_55758/g.145420 Transcript_55758/m.145420 type:complete len:222 (-) Transcript_55758:92-757(-)